MSEFNFSYSLGTTQTPSPSQPAISQPQIPEDPTLWSFTGVELVNLNDGMTLLVDRVGGQRLLVSPEVGIVLTHCETFRTLRGHAEYLVRVLPELGGQVEPVIPTLAQIRDAGLMRSANSMVKTLSEGSTASSQAPFKVFIITCDRPEALERLIASLESAPGLSAAESYCVIDDSRQDANAAKNAALVNACNARGTVTFNYFGMAEREQFIDRLISGTPHHADSVHFLLSRGEWGSSPTYGISRSLALLLSAGKRAVILDDDVICEAIRSPLPNSGLHFGSIQSREAVFYGGRDELLANSRRLSDNPINLAARQLGMPLSKGISSLLHGELPADALAGANGAFMRTLNPSSKILKTQCSTWGDPGTGSGHWIVGLNPESIGRLLDSPAGVSATVDARACWLGYTGPTLTKHGVMSQLTGYDATELLPPFFPAFRGEDSLFAFMLTTLHPDSLVLSNDWAITHLPLEERGQRSLRGEIAARGGMSLLTRWLGDNVDLSEGIAPATRLARIAQSITELAELGEKDLINFGRVELAKAQAGQLAEFEMHLQMAEHYGSDTWLQYLQRGHQEILEALKSEPSLNDMLGANSEDTAALLASVRQAGGRFAQALRAWPEIWQTARDLD